MIVTVDDLRAEAEAILCSVAPGPNLDDKQVALIDIGLKAAVTCLDRTALEVAIQHALSLDISPPAIGEIIALVSGLGVHSLMMSCAFLLAAAQPTAAPLAGELDAERQNLWARHVGDNPYWHGFETECPGFLQALLRLSPVLFQRFFEYCAVPWEQGFVSAATKELTAMAVDASPTHRFRPGFLLHLRNALKIGVGRQAIVETLDIASSAPRHNGVR